MSSEETQDSGRASAALIRLLTGLTQGSALFALHRTWDAERSWAHDQPVLHWGLTFAVTFAPIVLMGGLTALRPRALAAWTAASALIAFGLALYSVGRKWDPADGLSRSEYGINAVLGSPDFVAWLAAAAVIYIAHHLVVGADQARKPVAPYPIYFDVAWKDAVQLALSALFSGVFWGVLYLGAALFNLIGVKAFEELITKDWFAWPASGLVFAAAVHVTDVRVRLIRGVRAVTLALLSWLMPLMALIAAAFLVALPFTGLRPLWNTGSAAAVLLGAAAALIILINAAYQDGEAETRAPLVLRHAGRLAAIVLVPLVGLAAYAIALRVGQYGWSPDRVTGAACALVGACYAGGYMFAAVRPGPWLRPLERTNVLTAVVAIAVLLVIFSPVADPARLSVSDQLSRLQSGRTAPAKFDFAFLHFDAGKSGLRALQRLARSGSPAVSELAKAELQRPSRYGAAPLAPAQALARITTHPAGRTVPADLLDPKRTQEFGGECLQPRATCDAFFLDMDGDGREEVLLGDRNRLRLWSLGADGRWSQQGWLQLNCITADALWRGEAKVVPPRYNDLEGGGRRARLDFDFWRDQPDPKDCPKR